MMEIHKKYKKIKCWLISIYFFGVPTSYLKKKNDYVHLVASTLGTCWVGVDSVTFPGMGVTGGQ